MVELSQTSDGLLRKSFAGDVFNSLFYANQNLDEQVEPWNVQFFSAVGEDPISNEMLEFIGKVGIDTSPVQRISNRRPGLYMIHLDGAERSFSYWREQSAAKLLARDEIKLNQTIEAASVVYFSGITLAILSSADVEVFLSSIAKAKADGKFVAFDPNIRPALWDDAARMRDVISRAAGHSNFILPSFDDEQSAFGDKTPKDTIERYNAAGAQSIVVKNGENGILVSHENSLSEFTTQRVDKPVDTTGAGDSFNGAFLAEYLLSNDISKAVLAGQQCAAHVICHHGALLDLENS